MKIVMYHYIREQDHCLPNLHFLHIDDFRRQLDFFQKEGRILNKDDIYNAFENRDPLKENDYLLTFDDGLRDHYTYVLPELAKRGVTGIFSYCTRHLENNKMLDVHTAHMLLAYGGGQKILKQCLEILEEENIKINYKEIMSKVYLFQKGGDDIKFKCIINYCIKKDKRRVVLEKLISKNTDILNIQKDFYMNEQELRNMEESGMIIGGHTVNHNVLSSLDEHDQREEIVNNIKVLEKILGHRIQWFCFPYGGTISYNETTIALLKEYGIHYCLSVEHRDVSTKDMASPFALPRYDCTCFPYGKSYITKNV